MKSIQESFWTDKKIKALKPLDRYLMLYLISNPHSHYSGIYYLPLALMAVESDLISSTLKKHLKAICDQGLVAYDEDYQAVWVVNMARHQTKRMNKINAIAGIRNQLTQFHDSVLVSLFLEHYQSFNISMPKGSHKHDGRVAQASSYINILSYKDELSNNKGVEEAPELDTALLNIFKDNPHIETALRESSYLRQLADPTEHNLKLWNALIGLELHNDCVTLVKEIAEADVRVARDPSKYKFASNTGSKPAQRETACRRFMSDWVKRTIQYNEGG